MRSYRRLGLVAASPLLLAACQYEGASSLPLPGTVGEDEGYAVTVLLEDATNLVEKETCRANDTVIGSVETVALTDDLQARVVCRIKDDVELPANVMATVRETSLLGERFLSLDVPQGAAPRGTLAADAVIPVSATRVDPDTELVLGALSQVLNGSGLANIETITRELNVALEQSDTRATLRSLQRFTGQLNANRDSLTATLTSLDRFSRTLADQRQTIATALDAVPAGLEVLDRQRPQLVAMLRSLSRLSRTAVPLIRRVKADTLAGLKHLAPVLTELTKQGQHLAMTIERVASWPFPHNALSVIKGDYGGMYGTISLDLDAFQEQMEEAPIHPAPPAAGPPVSAGTPEPGLPGLLGIPDLADLPGALLQREASSGVETLLDDLLGGGR